MSAFAKHQTLMWKNVMIMKQRWKSVVFEIFFPVSLVILFTWLFREYGRDIDGESRMATNEQDTGGFQTCWIDGSYVSKILYSPTGPWLDSFMQETFNVTYDDPYPYGPNQIVGMQSAQTLDDYLNEKPDSEHNIMAVQFDDSFANTAEKPNILNFTLRFPNTYGSGVHYCFDKFQSQIEKAFIGPNDFPNISLFSFTYVQSSHDVLNSVLKVLLPILIIFSTFYTVNRIIKNVAHERECQLKETMRIMGLSSALHWMAWFSTSLWLLINSFALILIFLTIRIVASTAFLPNVNQMILWYIFTLYNIAVITFCFLMSVIFKKANTAGNVGTIIFMVTFIFFYQFRDNFAEMNYFVKMLYCLPVNTALGQVLEMILQLDMASDGVGFSNVATRIEGFNFSVLEMMMMFVIISVIQMSLTIYIEQVFTGDIGVAKPWWFPVGPVVRMFKSDKEILENSGSSVSGRDYEPDPTNLKKGIEIVDLSKSFGSARVVNNFSLNLFENQISVLLGHNGAGKTTTMNMLTGMFSPTQGTAFLNGFDITTETVKARSSLGLCPQHNVLFDELTVGQHITFFCKMKGMSNRKEIKAEVEKYADLLGFKDKVNALSSTLSGGQKRKLSIGVALCGNSKIVMLDEPTSGLDAGARRDLWNLLIQEKQGRTILLTTHHMDEADVLGDRIAIMNEGELQTVGSPFFLKRRFGSGYKFICVKNQGFQANNVLAVLKEFAPDAKLESNAQTEAVFVINEENLPNFHRMFKRIENEQDTLRISSFGCSLTTLEEVFIKVGSQVDKTNGTARESLEFNDFVPSRKVTGLNLFWYQVFAMILKKFHYTRRNLYSVIWLTLITIGISYALLAAPTEFNFNFFGEYQDPTEMSLRPFKSTVTPLEHHGAQDAFVGTYMSLFSGKDRVEPMDENHTEFIFKKFQGSFTNTFNTYPIGISVLVDEIIAWFHSDYSYSHLTKPVSLNLAHRALLKLVAGSDADIHVYNRPFNQTPYWDRVTDSTTEGTTVEETTDSLTEDTTLAGDTTVVGDSTLAGDFSDPIAKAEDDEDVVLTPEQELSFDSMIVNFILIFLLFFIVLTYWPSVIIAINVKERVTRSKLLQFISGTNRFTYWFSSFCLDYILLLVVWYILAGVVALNQRPYFRTGEQIGVLMTLIAIYGFTTVPFVYAFSFLFQKHSTAETMVPVVGLIFGALYLLYAIVGLVMEMAILPDVIYWIGLFFGPFNLIDCFRKYAVGSAKAIQEDAEPYVYFDFNQYGLNSNIIMMLASGITCISICLMADHLVFERMFYKVANRSAPTKAVMTSDDDVLAETKKIKNMEPVDLKSGNLVLTGLSKSYKSNLAVNQLHLGVDNSECFGLLGVNGAGKTSTFKMMTGDEMISSGDVWIRGHSMRNDMLRAQKIVGYCPQFDALMFEISGRECLKIFSLIRGIPRDEIDDIIVKLATELGFHMHLDKQIQAYSGGNKRKISTALSLIGDPSLIFLDEPTTGIDPYSKRQLWTIINKTRNSGKSVVLTSHSMEECEALCTRIAIMVAGEFKCLGSAQHLKNKFSKGFILQIKMKSDDNETLNEIRNKIHTAFPATHLKEKYLDLLTFHLNSAGLKWSEVFEKMAQLKPAMPITDFTVTQMSLEEVFLHFTREGAGDTKFEP